MPFDSIVGQRTAVETLSRALQSGTVHHAYRFEGMDGVGKERTALAFAQALVCVGGEVLGCGRCDACRRVLATSTVPPPTPLHPDVIYLARGLYPPEMLGGRKESNEISVEQVRRVVLSRVGYPPHEGRARVFIVRQADQLSVSAANALLKTLEEPRPATHFVLMTARPDRLLDTIISRTLPVRFGPLPDGVLGRLLREQGVDEQRIESLIELGGGSLSVALAAADPDTALRRDRFVRELLAAADGTDLGPAIALAESLDRNRQELIADLRAAAAAFVREARREVARAPRRAERAAKRHVLVLDAIVAVERNGAAALALPALVASLQCGQQRRPGRLAGR